MAYDANLLPETFKNPVSRNGPCNFAFNERLGGLRLTDISEDTVLLFEADGDWNLHAGSESLRMQRNSGRQIILVMTKGQKVFKFLLWTQAEQVLRWEP